ncbi:MAG TPA: recombinase family protein [Terriglobales bacterium]|nr:recombinase family protein [Terriglobales bacterium]
MSGQTVALIAAVLYARVSSREQEQEGYSIPAQLKLLREYAIRNGFRIVREFVDVETAKTTGRKSFGEMVEFLKRTRSCRIVLVEKTDRLYRNFRDAVTLEDLETEIHFVKENQVLSKNSRSQDKLTHGLHLLIARNYVENLREEVIKGMREKAEQGIYPGRAPFGYRNNRETRSIEIHPENAKIVQFIFERYATANYSLITLRQAVHKQFGKIITRSYLHTILTNPVYIGIFEWAGKSYRGTHETFISPTLFESVQDVIHGHHKSKYRKHEIAFRGLLTCAHDHCTVTAERKKGKYVYYRCSGYRGKCDLPRFREEEISEKLGTILKNIHVPDEVAARIEQSLERDQLRQKSQAASERTRLEQKLEAVRRRMDQSYTDKLDGKIAEDFWQRKMIEWQAEEQRITMALAGLQDSNNNDRLLDAKRILELANKAYFLYLTRKPAEQAQLLKMVLLNCEIDGASLYPTYRKPFDLIFQRVKNEEWSGREDLNLRPPGPEPR